LGRLPHVRQFIKLEVDEGAGSYDNVEIEFISGKKPILTIYDDGVETEQIALADYNGSFQELHALFKEKGFIQKPRSERIVEEEDEDEEDDDDDDDEEDDDDDFDDYLEDDDDDFDDDDDWQDDDDIGDEDDDGDEPRDEL